MLGLRIYDTRNLIVAAPFAAICIVAVATALPWRPVAAFAGALVAAAMVWAYAVDVDLGRTPYNAIDAGLVQLGWSPSSPLLMFARYPQSRPLAWHLPGHPRLRASAPGPGRCPAAYAVVTNDAGRRWLKAHAAEVAAVRRFPWYGGEPVAPRRSPDVTVARLRPSRAALADAVADRGFLFHPFGGRRPPCLGDSR